MITGRPSVNAYFARRDLCVLWRNFNDTCHKYSSCEWPFLKKFSRSGVKGQESSYEFAQKRGAGRLRNEFRIINNFFSRLLQHTDMMISVTKNVLADVLDQEHLHAIIEQVEKC